MALCSIVSCAHNQLPFTQLFVDSVTRCTDHPYELILVDNASTDGTAEFLAGRPDVRVERNAENLGVAGGWNQGLRLARGDYLAVCNNDIVVTPGWLSRLIEVLEGDERLGIAVPATNIIILHFSSYFPEAAERLRGRSLTGVSWEALDRYYEGFFRFALWCGRRYADLRIPNPSFDCVVMRRSLLEDVGFFEEGFGLAFMEDVDFVQRVLLNHRHNLIHCCGSVYIHHFGNATTRTVGGAVLYREAQVRFAGKWGTVGASIYGEYQAGRLGPAELARLREELVPQLSFL